MLRKRRLFLLLACSTVLGCMAVAQVTTGTISGTIKDETAAVLPGVAVTATNLDTGITRTAVMEDVGLTPLQALQTATKNPADFYLKGKRLGTLEAGKPADLIVVRGDPLQDIRNTRNIELVMKDGQILETGYHAWYSNPYRRPFSGLPIDRPFPAVTVNFVTPYVATQGGKGVVVTIKGTGFRRDSVAW